MFFALLVAYQDTKSAHAFSLVCKKTADKKNHKEIFGNRKSYVNALLQKMINAGNLQITGFLRNASIQASIVHLSLTFANKTSHQNGQMLQTIVQAFTHVQSLHLYEGNALPLTAIQEVTKLPLKKLSYRISLIDDFHVTDLFYDERIAQIKKMQSLEQLILQDGVDFSDANIQNFTQLPLKEFVLKNTCGNPKALDIHLLPLTTIPTLEKIGLCSYSPDRNVTRLTDLISLANLKQLDVRGSDFEDLLAFQQARPDVKVLTK